MDGSDVMILGPQLHHGYKHKTAATVGPSWSMDSKSLQGRYLCRIIEAATEVTRVFVHTTIASSLDAD